MLAYRSTLLALPQMKSECPAAEPSVISESTIHCGVKKSSEFFSEVGDTPTSKVQQNALFPHKKSKSFLGRAPLERGTPPPQTLPLCACGASNPARPGAASTPSASRPYPAPYSEIQSASAPEWWGWGGESNCFGDWFDNSTESFKF